MTDNDKKKMIKLMEIIDSLNWEIIVMADLEKDHVPGLIIGERQFLDKIGETLQILEESLNIPIKQINNEIPKSRLKPKSDNDPTYH